MIGAKISTNGLTDKVGLRAFEAFLVSRSRFEMSQFYHVNSQKSMATIKALTGNYIWHQFRRLFFCQLLQFSYDFDCSLTLSSTVRSSTIIQFST